MVTIYKLVDPRDFLEIPEYIGKSRNVVDRLRDHIGKPHSPRLRKWVKELKDSGCKPSLVVLRVVSEGDWSAAEREEVKNARKLNPRLLNISDGGTEDGPPHDLAVKLGRHMGKIAFQRNPERYRKQGEWLAKMYSQTEDGRFRASVRAKKSIVKAHATMRQFYYGTERHLQNTSEAGKRGILVAQVTIREGYWKTEKCQSDRSMAGRLRAAATNHKRWHLDRGRVVRGCRFCDSNGQ
jgi:hypothetical protein